ncbi:MAG TPA: hypothetical protein VIR98_01835 [Candidatus Paceibacterota bacterium]|jgi:hypothetical protein
MTGIPEGTCIMTKVDGSDPQFILAYQDHALDKDNNLVDIKDWAWNDHRWDDLGIKPITLSEAVLRKLLGQHWIGLPPRQVEHWRMAWSEWSHVTEESAEDKKGKERKKSHDLLIRTRVEDTCYFLMKRFGYAFYMKGVETCEGIKIDIKFTIFIEGHNPEIALVDNEDWFLTFEGLVREQARKYVRGKSLIQLLAKDAKSPEVVTRFLGLPEYLAKMREEAGIKASSQGETIRDDFDEFMFAIRGKKKKDPRGEPYPQPEDAPLREALGIRIVDATFEELDVDENDPIVKVFSLNLRTAMENASSEQKNKTANENLERTAVSKAKAYKMQTEVKADRLQRVEMPVLQVQVKMQELATQAKLSEAAAVEKNPNLRTVFFSSMGTNIPNIQPAISLTSNDDDYDDGSKGSRDRSSAPTTPADNPPKAEKPKEEKSGS